MRLVFIGDRNTPGKKDWSGAFRPEADRFQDYYPDSRILRLPLAASATEVRRHVLDEIERTVFEGVQLESVAFFCHGYQNRIQLGFTKATVTHLASALYDAKCQRVALYACSTGGGIGPGGDGGFADALRDALCAMGWVHCRVLAHATSGHATMNPRKRFFDGMGSTVGGTGGYDIVTSGSKLWRQWCKRLRDPQDSLRFKLLDMDIVEIHDGLR